jgi:hypothetical protein
VLNAESALRANPLQAVLVRVGAIGGSSRCQPL